MAINTEPWSKWSNALVMDAVRNTKTNDVRIIHDILLTDNYLAEVRKDPLHKWSAENSYLKWQQFAAVEAAQRPDVFGEILLSYYYGSPDELKKLSPNDQIVRATLTLIQQLDANGVPYEIQDYDIQKVTLVGEKVEVEAGFMKPLSGSGYKIYFKKFRIAGQDLWLPIQQDSTWIS